MVRSRGILTTTSKRTRRSGKSLDLYSRRESYDKDRYSTVSYTETGVTPSQGFDSSTMESLANAGASRPRYDSNQLLTLPAPLALNRPATYGGSSSSVTRSSEDVYSDHSSSHHRLVSSPTSNTPEQPVEDYHGTSASTPSRRGSPGRGNLDHQNARSTSRQATAQTPFPGEANPFQSGHDGYYGVEQDVGPSSSPSPSGRRSRARGVSLSDNGPVPGPDGVRRVSRPSRRTSQPPQQNRYSRTTSVYASLPPGAAPPSPNGGLN